MSVSTLCNFISILKKRQKLYCATDHVVCFLLAPPTFSPQIPSIEFMVRTNFVLPWESLSFYYPGEACIGKCYCYIKFIYVLISKAISPVVREVKIKLIHDARLVGSFAQVRP